MLQIIQSTQKACVNNADVLELKQVTTVTIILQMLKHCMIEKYINFTGKRYIVQSTKLKYG
jgi:hypothetical protein